VDAGGTFCVNEGILSLAICRPAIRCIWLLDGSKVVPLAVAADVARGDVHYMAAIDSNGRLL
jgi:hypothetical protein